VISEKHNAVFIHIPKTGGQSIETAFLASLGLEWDNRSSLLLRFNPDRKMGPERLAHLFGYEYEKLGYAQKSLGEYFTFSFVRNPYDRAVSEFNYQASDKDITIRDYFSRTDTDTYNDKWRHICPQTNYLFNEEREFPITGNIFRFEDMERSWSYISDRVFGVKTPLLHVNKAKVYRMHADDLTREDIDFINEMYQEDFRNFDYEMK
jgi:hypothetical protein